MSKSLSVPISSWWPVRYYLQVICTAQHFTVHCTNNNWCRCLHLLFYTSHCNLTIRLYVACKKMKHCPRIRVVICATSTYLFTSHWMLVTSFWLWRKKFLLSKALKHCGSKRKRRPTAFVYSVLSHHNQTGFQWELLKCKASGFNWRRTLLERVMS